ncbi:hypothetical protein AB0F13_09350 [Streptomyces sp. NPDC026206]|uniref:hypothetical protein n=1 Tax=Streptomyces sp. NPDC026206 TaxID=3157089 RepID=UPI0034087584
MPTHSMLPGRHHAHEGPGPVPRTGYVRHGERTARSEWAVPVAGGVVLGLYTVFLAHENGFSELSGWLLGLVAALASTALGYVLVRERHRMMIEARAVAFGALFGASMGFLRSLVQVSVLRAAGTGLVFGLCMAVVAYYVFYWHER